MRSLLPDWLTRREKTRKRPTKRRARRRKLSGEGLESRQLLTAVSMTDYEQLLLELVNRARANPLAEVARNDSVASLNEGVSGSTITSTPKQPLAPLQVLIDAGRLHAQDMLANDYFSHYTGGAPNPAPPAEPLNDPSDRAEALGYSGPVGENIAWNGATGPIDNTVETMLAHENLFASPSHRVNMLVDNYDHVGMAVEFGVYTDDGTDFNVAMVAEEFGFNSGNPYLTGVAFSDAVEADDFYTVGESLAGVRITAINVSTGTSYWTTTGPSGGYQIQLPAGAYSVVASGGGLPTVMKVNSVIITTDNVKVDFDSSEATVTGEDLVGITGNQFWVGQSNGTKLGTVYYGTLPSAFTYTHLGTGDFNGDGLDDYASRASNGDLYISISRANSSYHISKWGNFATVASWGMIDIGDFNGDGLDDIIGRIDNDGSFWVARSTGNQFFNSHWGQLSTVVDWLTLEVGDFNGDGNDDIAGRAQDGTWWIARSNGTDRLLNSFWGSWSSAVTWTDVTVGDYNGDGLDDIMGRVNAQFWVNRSSGNDYFFIEYWGAWGNVAWEDVVVGDFDGDGDDDVAGRVFGQIWLARSNGSQFQNQFWTTWSLALTYDDVQIIDINGDGQDDIIGRASNGKWWVAKSTGNGFVNDIAATWSSAVTWSGVRSGEFI